MELVTGLIFRNQNQINSKWMKSITSQSLIFLVCLYCAQNKGFNSFNF